MTLGLLVDVAYLSNDLVLCRAAAEAYLSHLALVELLANKTRFPCLSSLDTDGKAVEDALLEVPWTTALKMLEQEDAECWKRILKLELRDVSDFAQVTKTQLEILRALKKHM